MPVCYRTLWSKRAKYVAAVAGCGLAVLTAPPSLSAVEGRPVLTTSKPIREISLDGNRFAWLQGATQPPCFRIYRFSFASGVARPLTRARCLETSAATFGRLVLAGSRAYWEESESGNTVRDWTIRSTVRPFASRTVAQGSADVVCPAGGTDIGPTAGSGTTFVYSTHDLFPSNPDCDMQSNALVSASRIVRIVARPTGLEAAVVPGVPGAPNAFPWGRLLAYRHGLIAVVPLPNGGRPWGQANRVEIHNATTGALVSELLPDGTIRAIALSPSVAAVLVRSDAGQNRIERYSAEGGNLLGATPVRSGVTPRLDIARNRIAYRVGNEIRIMRVDTGTTRLVARARSAFPRYSIGPVQIEHNRVLWYVSGGGHSRIFQLVL